ncbi:hypothetical protein GCM10025867_17940 [Frondihabitans sucicola]|uniref:Uncharacterized protein n=1 Tax=Frondihabitans sucicola TaxID=1268041 RepID=A0ABM8GMB0_9MICO|nr:hypothetical protein GCM10025867_17940 [Frondihabitans sucicola]
MRELGDAEVAAPLDIGDDVEPDPVAAEVLQRRELPRGEVRGYTPALMVGATPM